MLAVIVIMSFLLVVGVSLAGVTSNDLVAASSDGHQEDALMAADAGVDYTIAYMNANNGSAPATGTWFTMPHSGARFQILSTAASNYSGGTVYRIEGSQGSDLAIVDAVLQSASSSSSSGSNPWNYGIFANGTMTEPMGQNASVAGSVCVLGTGISSTTAAVDMTQGAYMFNNYDDEKNNGESNGTLYANLATICPPQPKDSGGKNTLNSVLDVKNGMVYVSGGTKIGWNSSGSGDHGTVNGIYVGSGPSSWSFGENITGGTNGNTSPTAYIFSDNGYSTPYPTGTGAPTFPNLTKSFTVTNPTTQVTTTYSNYTAFANAVGYTQSGNISIIPDSLGWAPTTTIAYPAGATATGTGNYLIYQMNNNTDVGTLSIHGVVHATGTITINLEWRTVTLQGSGVLIADQNIGIGGQIEPGTYTGPTGTGGFPNNCLGLVASGTMGLGSAINSSGSTDTPVTDIPGASYCAGMTTFGPECHLLGSMVTGDFNFARNGAVIQVPTLSSNLPWGMPGPATQTTAKVQSYYREQ